MLVYVDPEHPKHGDMSSVSAGHARTGPEIVYICAQNDHAAI